MTRALLGAPGSSPKSALTVTGRDRGAGGLWLVGGTCTGALKGHLQVVSLKVRLSQITVLCAEMPAPDCLPFQVRENQRGLATLGG